MLGDPGTAKSQLLKFVEKCSPIGVGGLRCPLIVWLFFSFCSLYSTEDQTVVIADTNLPVHPWLDMAGRAANHHFWCLPRRDGLQDRGRRERKGSR